MFKLMIADDEILERQALKLMLKDLESIVCVAEACNGREAIEYNREFNPDIIIMDIKMPGINGIKASEIIKAENAEKVIIIITAYDDFDLVRKALVLGVNDYILKPIRASELINVMNNIIVNFKINDSEVLEKSDKIEEIIGSESEKKYIESKSPIQDALEYINKNLNQNTNLEKIAGICNLSSCYFSKLFKKEVGMNFITYVNKVKINKAKEILKSTDIPILNIAMDLGFEDCGYFIRVFKKVEGVTPKKYRDSKI
ncbi:response regulator transcription factor [Clostridium frigidicarnis]|uniref:Stage 0 sporulation protein A homolog n=1 Tax=Clostridium frigidicarnis TaxID=84698 RepID=A0A1I1ACV9_9CLOT|nr:response regulator [Clostridium frigidicarnis]SFB34173.1 Helix-turn-helix domain-containing protein [Clostridium frigidicarnis]